MIAEGHAVKLVTIFVHKRRCSYIGINIEGAHHPRITSSRDTRFQIGDCVYIINGRLMHGSKQTAMRIWWKSRMSITLMRRGAADDFVFPTSIVVDNSSNETTASS